MSGGTPVGGGYMRQRHSQGYASSGDDLEDDACSRPQPFSPPTSRPRTWLEILENALWIASALFIIYYGDRHSNFIYLLWHDDRIRSSNVIWLMQFIYATPVWLDHYELFYHSITIIKWHLVLLPLYLGLLCFGLNVTFFFYSSMLTWSVRRFDEKWELFSMSALPFVTLLGLVSFCLLSFALWPIWSFLTLPLLFTLFMACMVIFPHSMIGTFRPQNDMFRID
ncbi:hypothetical protein Pint_13048 [Pistacia integerrima]|uniref:Uncharacterized protein n=1 Tax=Pistacia integerrima TaxID=434235 RepID=A0ACC0Y7Y6_9ROSI|nr:hypothetical protein Pint_13048 [Pistacia integerrima]